MTTIQSKAKKEIERLANILVKNGVHIPIITESTYNYSLSIDRRNNKLKLLVYFGKKGVKTILQGNDSSEYFIEIKKILFGADLFEEEKKEIKEPEEYIGTDESGKGDYFGPLVIAGVFVNKNSLKKLKEIGVKDSKELKDNTINILAEDIKKIIGGKFNVIAISPKKYNRLYSQFGNLNKLLGWAHAKVLENILMDNNANVAISDKFANESVIKNSLQEKGKKIKLFQFNKAEKYTAVAAASILARANFNKWFYQLEKNKKIKLPKGASQKVEIAAKKIVDEMGKDELSNYVKYHFKTTKKILAD